MDLKHQQVLEHALQLARCVESLLAPVAANARDRDALAARLAQAYALGLVDQLVEMVGAEPAHPPAVSKR